ncbi:MAG: hypothetical protein ACRDS9_12085 [Pseudonocardiaceae bacterium]
MSTRLPTERTVVLLCNFPQCPKVATLSADRWFDDLHEIANDITTGDVAGWSNGGTVVPDPAGNGYTYEDDESHYCPDHPRVSERYVTDADVARFTGNEIPPAPAVPYLLTVADTVLGGDGAYLVTETLHPWQTNDKEN